MHRAGSAGCRRRLRSGSRSLIPREASERHTATLSPITLGVDPGEGRGQV